MQRIIAQVMFKTVTVLLSLKIIVHPKNETSVIKKTNFLSLKLQNGPEGTIKSVRIIKKQTKSQHSFIRHKIPSFIHVLDLLFYPFWSLT